MRTYTDTALATRYNLPLNTVTVWIREEYLKGTKTENGYTVKEKDLRDFERIPPLIYEAFEEASFLSDIGEYISYGIKVTSLPAMKIVRKICDVSVNKERVEEFCRLATEGILSLCHLDDVLEEYFY